MANWIGPPAPAAPVPGAAAFEFHPFMAQRFEQAVLPALSILVVDHDARPLERLVAHVGKADAAWVDLGRLDAQVKEATEAVRPLPLGSPPEELIGAHEVGKDAHTGRDCVADPPAWARALGAVAATLCVATRRTPGWNPRLLERTDEGETLERFVEAARRIHPQAFAPYSKLTSGLIAWMQGGRLRGYLTDGEVRQLREALTTTQEQTLMWKERGGDFHRRKVQAFCFLAEKHGLGLAAVAAGPGVARPASP